MQIEHYTHRQDRMISWISFGYFVVISTLVVLIFFEII